MPKMSCLSSRELQIAQAYALGSNYRQISDRLCISPSTVRTHLRTIYRKLGVSSKIGLLRMLEDADHHGTGVLTAGPARHRQEPSPATELRERCFLSMMSCSLVNTAALSAELDAEDLCDLAAAFRDCTERVVGRYRGHVTHVVDCSMTACFGYPRADEHDAECAVCAALELVTEMKALAGPLLPELQTRIGIASGEVVVNRRIREDGLIQEAIAGEALHIVAALQRIAEPDGVLVAESTKRLLGDLFEYQDNGDRLLEGADLSIRTWRVLSERSGQSRFQAIRGATELGSLVGRDEQMDLLTRRWQRAKAGVGHVVVLTGEPGIGKSRLIRALCESVADEPHCMLSYHCSPHHQDSALYPVINQLASAADCAGQYPPDAKLDRLEAMPAQATTLEVTGAQILGLAKQKPVLVVFEDLQWGEPTTRELVDWLVERVRTMPALVLISQRADAPLPWVGDPGVTSLALSRLDHRDSEKLVMKRLGGKRLPQQWLAQIVGMADGVPLFLEELTRNVVETHAPEADPDGYALVQSLDAIAIPSTLRDLLEVRIDRLGQAKSVAQQGAVIGRHFSYELLAAVSPLEESELVAALAKLADTELVSVHGAPPAATYTFKHALVQDAAYRSLRRADRKTLHARIKSVLESRYPSMKEREPEVLARHSAEAGFKAAAVEYWRRAGEHAVERSSNIEAIGCFSKALGLLRTLPRTARHSVQELELQLRLGRACMLAEGYAVPQAEAAYLRARELCEELGDTHRLFFVLLGLWQIYTSRQDVSLAVGAGSRLLPLAKSQGDADFELEAHVAESVTCHVQGKFDAALAAANAAFALYEPAMQRRHAFQFGHEAGLMSCIMASWPLWCLGYPDQALDKMQAALNMALKLAHPYSQAMALYCSAWLHQYRRESEAVRTHAEQAIGLSNEQGLIWPLAFATVLHGWALAEEGQAAAGISEACEGLAMLEQSGIKLWRPHVYGMLANAHANAGHHDEAAVLVRQALDVANRTGEEEYAAELYRQKGELALRCGSEQRLSEAAACFNQAIDVAQRQHAKAWELRAATSLAKLRYGQGKSEQARTLLGPIYGRFTEGHDTPDLQHAKELLESLA